VVKRNDFLLPVIVLAIVALALACQSAGGPAGSNEEEAGIGASGSEAIPTLDELRNAFYRGFEGQEEPVALVNGTWKGEPFEEGGASRPEVHFVGDRDRRSTSSGIS